MVVARYRKYGPLSPSLSLGSGHADRKAVLSRKSNIRRQNIQISEVEETFLYMASISKDLTVIIAFAHRMERICTKII
jgi:hypothetical protein